MRYILLKINMITKNSNKCLSRFASHLALALSILLFLASCSSNQSKLNADYVNVLNRTSNTIYNIDTNYVSRLAVDFVISASNLQQEGRYAEAILDYFEALKYDSSASIYYSVAKNYKELYRYYTALEFALAALRMDSSFVPAMKLLVEIYKIQSRNDAAVTVYKQIVKFEPTKMNKQNLAWLYEFTDPHAAAEIYEDILSDGTDLNVLTRLSSLYAAINDKEKFIGSLIRLDKANPNNGKTKMALIEYYLRNKKYPEAEEQVEYINKNFFSPELETSFLNIANMLTIDSSMSSNDLTVKFLKLIDKRFYFDWKIQQSAGFLYDKLSDSINSEKYLKHALQIADTIADVPLQISNLYSYRKKFNKAIALLSEYETKFPNDSRFPLYIGSYFTQSEDYENALSYLFKALSLDSSHFEIYAELGITYDKLGKKDSSDAMYGIALKYNPTDPLVNNNYAYSLSERGINLEFALNMVTISLKADPENPFYLDTYGWVQYKLKNYDIALEYINRAIANGDVSSEAYEHLGEIWLSKGNPEKAKSILTDALKRFPDNQSIIAKLKEIE